MFLRRITSVLLLVAGCSMSKEPEESSKMVDVEQKLLLGELTADEIPFRLDEHGGVWYRVSLRDRVAVAQQRVLARTRPLNAVSFESQSAADALSTALSERSVGTKRWTDLGLYWVQWDNKDEKTVAEVEFALNKRTLQERYGK